MCRSLHLPETAWRDGVTRIAGSNTCHGREPGRRNKRSRDGHREREREHHLCQFFLSFFSQKFRGLDGGVSNAMFAFRGEMCPIVSSKERTMYVER